MPPPICYISEASKGTEGGAPMKQEIVLELFDRYADIVYRIALSYLRSPQEAEDVVQTVFLKLLEGGMIVY